MPDNGFGHGPFGHGPFGKADWARIVLWDELPVKFRERDEESGGYFRKFVFSLCPSFNWLRDHIAKFKDLTDPRQIRHDLLEYLAGNFGISIDLAEPEEYQRMRTALATRWNLIKGLNESYVVLCRVHGFEAQVLSLWWDGSRYLEDNPPTILREAPTYSKEDLGGGDSKYKIWLTCNPVEPSSLTLRIGATTITDDGDGALVGVTGTIDYGWGFIYIPTITETAAPSADYDSEAGGCVSSCGRCLTHRIRLVITPGTIGGQTELTITEAFQRLWDKLRSEVKPVHVEFESLTIADAATVSIGFRYDVIPADEEIVDTGLRWELS